MYACASWTNRELLCCDIAKKFPKMYYIFREQNMKNTYKKFPKGD